MEKKLISIQELNDKTILPYRVKGSNKSGVECLICKNEMIYPDNSVFLSNPPQKRIKCMNCGYFDNVLA